VEDFARLQLQKQAAAIWNTYSKFYERTLGFATLYHAKAVQLA
jgi:hypothetical protein